MRLRHLHLARIWLPDPIAHYVAESISSADRRKRHSGVTAGAGLAGGGTSGVVSLNLDLDTLPFLSPGLLSSADSIPIWETASGTTGRVTTTQFLQSVAGAGLAHQGGDIRIADLGVVNAFIAEDTIGSKLDIFNDP